ncbi:tyrosine-type recombinase/integrase [Pontibacter sp. CAU 1760]
MTDSYARKFKQVAGHLENFRPGLHPRDLTEKVWHEYLKYLYEDAGVQDSTVGKHLQSWKVALKETGLPHEHHWLRNTFNSQKLKPDLSWPEVLKLANHTYEDMQLQEAAHAFVIDCQLALRWGDLSTLTENHLIELNTPSYGTVQCFRKRQGKTGQPVLVPLPPLGAKLFHQYKMVPVPRAARTGTPNLTEYNKRLKKAAAAAGLKRMVAVETIKNGHVTEEMKPLHKVISSHSARHTAATRIREAAGYELAQLLLGHAATSNTAIYAHLDPVKTAERVLKAWEYYK